MDDPGYGYTGRLSAAQRNAIARQTLGLTATTPKTGDKITHATLGEGVVLRFTEARIVTARFGEDPTERVMEFDYAPLRLIRACP